MRQKLAQFDKGLARGEAFIATLVLLSLVLVAATQSLFRNFADTGATWANDALAHMEWGDGFMEKATLWLAMFGASLATHYDKHIGIDVMVRIARPKARAVMRGIAQAFAGITCFYFARVVLGALLAKAARIPAEFGVFDANFDTIHICLGSAEQIEAAGYVRPDIFCTIRGMLDGLGLQVNTPERAMDLLVPALFCLIGVRFLLKGAGSFMRVREGGIPDSELEGGDDPTRLPDEIEADKKKAETESDEDEGFAVTPAIADGKAAPDAPAPNQDEEE